MSGPTRRFARHYVEMVIAMFAAMGLLGIPAGWARGPLGTSWSDLRAARATRTSRGRDESLVAA